jgi:hypothetical protein
MEALPSLNEHQRISSPAFISTPQIISLDGRIAATLPPASYGMAFGYVQIPPGEIANCFKQHGPFSQIVPAREQAVFDVQLEVKAGCKDTDMDRFMLGWCSIFSFGLLEVLGLPILGKGQTDVLCTVTPNLSPHDCRTYASSSDFRFTAPYYTHTETAARETGASLHRCLQTIAEQISRDKAAFEGLASRLAPSPTAATTRLPTVTVMTFAAQAGISSNEASLLGDRLETELRKLGNFRIFPRNQLCQSLGNRKSSIVCAQDSYAFEVGKLLKLDYVVFGFVEKTNQTYRVHFSVADVVVEQVGKPAVVSLQGEFSHLLGRGMATLARRMLGLPDE